MPSIIAPSKTGGSNTRSECHLTPEQISPLPAFGNSYREASLATGIDWLSFTFDNLSLACFQQLVQFVSDSLESPIVLEPGTSAWFGRSWSSSAFAVNGSRLYWDSAEDGSISRLIIDINGGSLRRLPLRDIWRFCLGLANVYKATCRRFDVFIDDYKRRIGFWDVVACHGRKEIALFERLSISGSAKPGELLIPTVYLGSRESEKFIRFYNAEAKHGIPADRWELELKRRHAQAAFRQFVAFGRSYEERFSSDSASSAFESLLGAEQPIFEAQMAPFLAGLVCGAVDFVEASDERYSRRERLSWWSSLVEEALQGSSAIRLSPPRPKPALERSIQWFKRQVACFLSCVREGWGRSYFYRWLDSQLKDAKARFGNYHRACVDSLLADFQSDLFSNEFSEVAHE
jgi:hypothetical protein